jgi:hypothetical protein
MQYPDVHTFSHYFWSGCGVKKKQYKKTTLQTLQQNKLLGMQVAIIEVSDIIVYKN